MPVVMPARKRCDFDPHAFLATIGEGRKFMLFPNKQAIFAQGDPLMQCFMSRWAR
jgi:hypothetical protein